MCIHLNGRCKWLISFSHPSLQVKNSILIINAEQKFKISYFSFVLPANFVFIYLDELFLILFPLLVFFEEWEQIQCDPTGYAMFGMFVGETNRKCINDV